MRITRRSYLEERVERVYGIVGSIDRRPLSSSSRDRDEKRRAGARKRSRAASPAVKVLLTFEGARVRATGVLGSVRDVRNST